MVDGRLPVGNTTQHLDTTVVTHDSLLTAHREGVFIGDPLDANARTSVEAINADQYGAHVIAHAAPGATDAFSRARVSSPVTLFDSQSQYDDGTKDSYFHKVTTGGSTSHNHDQACVDMTTDATAGASVIRQSQRYIRYQPGKSQLIYITFDFSAVDGGTKEVGYGDAENGIFLRMDASGNLSLFKRSKRTGSVVETEVQQADWSEDKFDGTGKSGVTLDGTKSGLLVVDLQWLSVGTVRVAWDIGGVIHYAHNFHWANIGSGVYMSTANLPIRYELTGNGNVSHLFAICSSVQSEGGFTADLGHEHATPNAAVKACPITVQTPIVSIRPLALFKTYTNRGTYIPTAISFYVSGNPVLLQVWHGGTLTGATFAATDAESGVEYDVAATAIANGHLVTSEFGAAAGGGKAFSSAGASDTQNRIYLTLDIDGANQDGGNYTITGTGLGGTAQVYCNIHWVEIK
jgi:hypothetical protein